MASLHHLLVGHGQTGVRTALWFLLAIGLFVTTLAGFALDVFAVAGGAVFVP